MSVSFKYFRVARFATAAFMAAQGMLCAAAAPAAQTVVVPEWYQGEVYTPQEAGVVPVARMEEEPATATPETTSSSSCCDSSSTGCCDYASSCCSSANCCEPCWTCYAGTEVTFLVPVIDEGELAFESDDGDNVIGIANTADDLRDMQFAPRVWLGAKRNCWGVVGRFWYLDACSSESNLGAFTTDLLGYDYRSNLEMYTIDFELTRDLCLWGSKSQGSFGVRFAEVDHNSQLVTISDVLDDTATYTSLAGFSQYARGTGLTGALSGNRAICGSCVSWFYAVRGSVLWGDTSAAAITQTSANSDGAQTSDVLAVDFDSDDPLFIGEFQLGLEAQHRLQCYPANAFFRVAFEYQHWTADHGSAFSPNTSGTGDPPTSTVFTSAYTEGVDMNLYGFSLGTGLKF